MVQFYMDLVACRRWTRVCDIYARTMMTWTMVQLYMDLVGYKRWVQVCDIYARTMMTWTVVQLHMDLVGYKRWVQVCDDHDDMDRGTTPHGPGGIQEVGPGL
jgi:hypothetical protein